MPNCTLITGAAGFVGFHLAKRLLEQGHTVVGVDSLSDYYSVALKQERLAILNGYDGFEFHHLNIADREAFEEVWKASQPDMVVHLAAQAGVRYSIDNPDAYAESNLIGAYNVLELARRYPVKHLLAASTSSVYGANDQMPFHETDKTSLPMSLYAASKGASELMAHSYAHLFDLPITMFRFFTVYGPWGRPDMAYFKFAKLIAEDKSIDVYNQGKMARDFTYIDDLIEAIVRLMEVIPGTGPAVANDSLSPCAPFRVVNIGQAQPVELMHFISTIEAAMGKDAKKHFMPMQMGDVKATHASVDLLEALTGYVPTTSVEVGVPRFVDWYKAYADASRVENVELEST